MSARILVVEHEAGCPPARFDTWLTEAGAELAVCRPWAGDELPTPADFDAVVILGGSMGANDDERHWWLGPVKQLIRDAVEQEIPTLGICLGHQPMGVALGGVAERSPLGQQVGLYDVGWRAEAADDPLVGDLGQVRGIQWNHDLVTKLRDGVVALAETARGELQVARFGPAAWGVQLHPEADELVAFESGEGVAYGVVPDGATLVRDQGGEESEVALHDGRFFVVSSEVAVRLAD